MKTHTKEKRIYITGPTGAVGTALTKIMLMAGYEVVAICRKGSERIRSIPVHERVKIVECDLKEIRDYSVEEWKSGEYFFHLAWEGTSGAARDDVEIQLNNVYYALDCVRLAKKLGCVKFVGVGSQAEYGLIKEKLSADTPTNPVTGYGACKLSASLLCRLEAQNLELKYNWVRLLSVYGPNDGIHTLVMSMIDKMVHNLDIELTEGVQMWDYLYSEDAARAICAVANLGVDGKTYVIGSGDAHPLHEYIEIIYKTIPTKSRLLWGKIPYHSQSVMYLCADLTDLEKDTCFKPKMNFTDGIMETYRWYKEKYLNEED